MAQIFRIQMLEEEKLVARAGNFITESSIRRAFLLPPDAIVSLWYTVGGMEIMCQSRITPEPHFVIPEGCETMTFTVKSHKPLSRPASPMDTSEDKVIDYVPLDVENVVDGIQKYLFYEESGGVKHCFTAISACHAVSYNHGHHETWVAKSKENDGTKVTIFNQAGRRFETEVIECNKEVDYVVVLSKDPLVSQPPMIKHACKLERYVLLGYPDSNSTYQALEGVFSSVKTNEQGRVRGSSGSQRGYSGGPIFSYRGELIGINVANESPRKFIGIKGESTVNELLTEISASFPPLSVIVTAHFIASKYAGYCRYKH